MLREALKTHAASRDCGPLDATWPAGGAEMLMSELSERTSELATLQQELVHSSGEVRRPEACFMT